MSLKQLLLALCLGVLVWSGLPDPAHASLHTYHERSGQTTVRSRLSLRDTQDRAWQAIAFKRLQGETLQGIYLRLVGFPGAVLVDRQQPLTLLAATGQHWQLPWTLDPQTPTLPENVGQYTLEPLLTAIDSALPLEMQLRLADQTVAEFAIAPFIVTEWRQVQTAPGSPAPVAASP
jgi:hypothetical protein